MQTLQPIMKAETTTHQLNLHNFLVEVNQLQVCSYHKNKLRQINETKSNGGKELTTQQNH